MQFFMHKRDGSIVGKTNAEISCVCTGHIPLAMITGHFFLVNQQNHIVSSPQKKKKKMNRDSG